MKHAVEVACSRSRSDHELPRDPALLLPRCISDIRAVSKVTFRRWRTHRSRWKSRQSTTRSAVAVASVSGQFESSETNRKIRHAGYIADARAITAYVPLGMYPLVIILDYNSYDILDPKRADGASYFQSQSNTVRSPSETGADPRLARQWRPLMARIPTSGRRAAARRCRCVAAPCRCRTCGSSRRATARRCGRRGVGRRRGSAGSPPPDGSAGSC